MLNRIVAIDETWIRDYEPEVKQYSKELRYPEEGRPSKLHRKQSQKKMMIILRMISEVC